MQYFLRKGEYPNYQQWMGFNDSIKSCCIITPVKGYKLMRNGFGNRMMESFCDNPLLSGEFHHGDTQSCQIFEGDWIFCGQPRECRRLNEWLQDSAFHK
uniref:Beta/gamma crystallin 'Greek key' domain-containing protein n=1 Tax=Pelusios castaneus TaxID=367368 RepID=A0A8C8T1M0_9SAUR